MPKVKPVPDGMHTVTPHLICAGACCRPKRRRKSTFQFTHKKWRLNMASYDFEHARAFFRTYL
jgi:hypothetical protein